MRECVVACVDERWSVFNMSKGLGAIYLCSYGKTAM